MRTRMMPIVWIVLALVALALALDALSIALRADSRAESRADEARTIRYQKLVTKALNAQEEVQGFLQAEQKACASAGKQLQIGAQGRVQCTTVTSAAQSPAPVKVEPKKEEGKQ